MSFEIRTNLGDLADVLAKASNDLQRNLQQSGEKVGREVTAAAEQSALRSLPRRGGMGRRTAGSLFKTRRRPTGDGVQVIATSRDSLRLIDRKGIIRHPVFGNREVWVNQPVPASWWTRPTEATGARAGARELVKARDAVVRDIERAL